MRTIILALVVAVSTTGCVAKSKYNELDKKLEGCNQSLRVSDIEKTRAEQRLAAEQSEKQALFQETQKLEGKTKEYEELVGSLKTEIDSGNVKISQMQDRLTINLVDKVLFGSGSTDIRKEGQQALSKIADVLKSYGDKRVLVEGHTDNVPVGKALVSKYPTNWELSAARATKIARFLSETGVEPARLAAIGFGEYRPVASNDTPDGRRENRRIEISLLKPMLEKVPLPATEGATPETK